MLAVALAALLVLPAQAIDTAVDAGSVVQPARDAVSGLFAELPTGQARALDAFLKRAADPGAADDVALRLALLDDALRGRPGVSEKTWHSLESAASLARKRLTDEQDEKVSRKLQETARALEALNRYDDGVGAGAAAARKPLSGAWVLGKAGAVVKGAPARRRVGVWTALGLPVAAAAAAWTGLQVAPIGAVLLIGLGLLSIGSSIGGGRAKKDGNGLLLHRPGTYLAAGAAASFLAAAGAFLGSPIAGALIGSVAVNLLLVTLQHGAKPYQTVLPLAAVGAVALRGFATRALGLPESVSVDAQKGDWRARESRLSRWVRTVDVLRFV